MCRLLRNQPATDSIKIGELTNTKAQLYAGLFIYRTRLRTKTIETEFLETEFTVLVLPLSFWRYRFYRVPVLCDLALMNAEKIIKGCGLTSEFPLTNHKHKISLAKNLVNT